MSSTPPNWALVTISLSVSFLTDFILGAGSLLSGAMIEKGTNEMPSMGIWILACIAGLTVGARRIQAFMATMPGFTTLAPAAITTTITEPTPGLPLQPTTRTVTRPMISPGHAEGDETPPPLKGDQGVWRDEYPLAAQAAPPEKKEPPP